MSALIEFSFHVTEYLLEFIKWLVIVNVVVSWLVAFDIVNLRNRAAYNAVRFLDRVVSPLLAPFRRFIPTLGGMDITPVILIIIIQAAQSTLIPALFTWLLTLVGGQVVT